MKKGGLSVLWMAFAAVVVATGCGPDGTTALEPEAAGEGRAAFAAGALLEGYASATSVGPNQTINFFVNHPTGSLTTGTNASVSFHRVGLDESVALASNSVEVRRQPAFASGVEPSEVGCNWSETLAFVVPSDWRSGLYYARFSASGLAPGDVYFVVRSAPAPANHSTVSPSILYQVEFLTAIAYNTWGGKSLYSRTEWNADGTTRTVPRLAKVSLNRPLILSQWHRYFIPWLELANIAVDYASSIDLHENPALLKNYQLFVTVGHDEYWTRPMRDQLDGFIGRGGNAAIFSGNTMWYQARLEPDAQGNPNRTLVCYKYSDGAETQTADPVQGALSTVYWHDPRVNYPGSYTIGLSTKSGAIYVTPPTVPLPFTITETGQSSPFLAGTGLLHSSAFGTGTLGYEMDALYCLGCVMGSGVKPTNDRGPFNFQVLGEANASNWAMPGWGMFGSFEKNGTVFNGGTTDWVKGLSANPLTLPNAMDRVTRNVLSLLSVPKTPRQAATRKVYQYHAAQADGWRFYYSMSPFIVDGWSYDGPAFWALQSPLSGTIPIYQHWAPQNGGIRMFYTPLSTVGQGWNPAGIAFHAYSGPGEGRVPVYIYYFAQADGGWRFFYSTSPNVGDGWNYLGPYFWVPQSMTSEPASPLG